MSSADVQIWNCGYIAKGLKLKMLLNQDQCEREPTFRIRVVISLSVKTYHPFALAKLTFPIRPVNIVCQPFALEKLIFLKLKMRKGVNLIANIIPLWEALGGRIA